MGMNPNSIAGGLFMADVMHARLKPRQNKFRYKVYYLCLRLEELERLNAIRGISLNRFNFFSVCDKDHGKKDGTPMQDWIENILKKWGLKEVADGGVVVVTLPRVLGYIFNPVSFWFCLDKQGGVRAVVSEVSNTFGEEHSYISFHDDKRAITQDDILEAKKMFHVSPFLKVEGYYKFRFAYKEDKIGVWIDYFDAEGEMLKTSLVGKRHELNTRSLFRSALQYPLITLKVIGLIHWQAIKLVSKRIRYVKKPPAPGEEITR